MDKEKQSQSRSKENSTFPPGYNSAGKSLFYDGKAIYGNNPTLWGLKTRVLRVGDVSDLQFIEWRKSSENSVYNAHSAFALKEYVRTTYGDNQIPTYIFDDHNHAFFAWFEAFREGKIDGGSTLFHIDFHSDSRKDSRSQKAFEKWTLKQAALKAHKLFNNNFIYPALQTKLVKDVYWIDNSSKEGFYPEDNYNIPYEIVSPKIIPDLIAKGIDDGKTIVDIDIDYFNHMETEDEEMGDLRGLMAKAGVITVALSPGFSLTRRAIEKCQKLLGRSGCIHPLPNVPAGGW